MTMTPRYLEAEHRFRALLADAGLPAPDAVEYEPSSVLFLWHDDRVAVYVDLDDPDAGMVEDFDRALLNGGGWTRAA